jgi:hypothetical protein
MFEVIKRVLEFGKKEDADLSVALRSLRNEISGDKLDNAEKFIVACFEEITYLNRMGDTENLEKICALAEDKKYLEVKKLVEELKETKYAD